MATSLRGLRRAAAAAPSSSSPIGILTTTAFSSSSSSSPSLQNYPQIEKQQQQQQLNLFSAINQALHIALETDPRSVPLSSLQFSLLALLFFSLNRWLNCIFLLIIVQCIRVWRGRGLRRRLPLHHRTRRSLRPESGLQHSPMWTGKEKGNPQRKIKTLFFLM